MFQLKKGLPRTYVRNGKGQPQSTYMKRTLARKTTHAQF